MTTFALKMIALICMVIDHIGSYIPGMPVQMRWIGRIAAPVYIFCLCEGIDHTSSEKKYLLRLYLSSLLMTAVQIIFSVNGNIFRTLFVIAVNLVMIKNIRKGNRKYTAYYLLFILYQLASLILFTYLYMGNRSSLITKVLPALSGSAAFCEYRLPLIILGIIMYLLKHDKRKLAIGISLYCAVYALLTLSSLTTSLSNVILSLSDDPDKTKMIIRAAFYTCANAFRPGVTGGSPLFRNFQWMMIGSLIPIMMYNGKKGRSMKWFFYAFYVVHLILLKLIGTLM